MYEKDEEARELKRVIVEGWPSTRSETPDQVKAFFNHRDELTMDSGVVSKGSNVILKPLRAEMLGKTHYSHIGMEASLGHAHDVLFWPGMAKEIKDFVRQCPRFNEQKPALPKELLINHETLKAPWSRLAMDISLLNHMIICLWLTAQIFGR